MAIALRFCLSLHNEIGRLMLELMGVERILSHFLINFSSGATLSADAHRLAWLHDG
jgi:hypothetical protein